MGDSDRLERAAELLLAARRSRRPIGPLAPELRPVDEADGYRLQAVLNRQLSAAGAGSIAGHKIGCTIARDAGVP